MNKITTQEINTGKEIGLQLHSQGLFDETESYISSMRIFFSYFAAIPNIKEIDSINIKRLKKWLENDYKDNILKIHYKQHYRHRTREMQHARLFYLLKNNFLLDIQCGNVALLFEPHQEEKAQQLIDEIKKFLQRFKRTSAICLVIKDVHGIETRSIKLKKPELDVSSHYNDDLVAIHKTVLTSLKKKEKSGLILFHGMPGTGKSTYIRYLIHLLNKKVIFLPPKLAGNLDSPELINMLLLNQNSVLVIEDAEELLVARENGNNSGISMLLNLTDGLLGESLGIQVIATFNTKVSNIDKALLRKGRLIALYEFEQLNVTKTNILLETLGVTNFTASQPLTLAEIYNSQDKEYEFKPTQNKPIGFLSQAV